MIVYKSVMASSEETHTIPDGETVVPTDDVQTFLHCANIWNCTYTTLNELLNDTRIMANAFVPLNAIDYLIRCTTWISDFCTTLSAMFLLASNSNSFQKLWGDTSWRTAITNIQEPDRGFILSQKVPVMASNTQPSGEVIFSTEYSNGYQAYYLFDNNANNYWSTKSGDVEGSYVGYKFLRKVKIYGIDFVFDTSQYSPKDFNVQYQNSQNEWVDVPDSDFTHVRTQQNVTYWITPVESSDSWRIYFKSNYYNNGNYIYLKQLQFYGTL